MKAVNRALVVVDLPFGTYQGNSKEALASRYPGDERDACRLYQVGRRG